MRAVALVLVACLVALASADRCACPGPTCPAVCKRAMTSFYSSCRASSPRSISDCVLGTLETCAANNCESAVQSDLSTEFVGNESKESFEQAPTSFRSQAQCSCPGPTCPQWCQYITNDARDWCDKNQPPRNRAACFQWQMNKCIQSNCGK